MKLCIKDISIILGIALLVIISFFETQLMLIFPTGITTILIIQIISVILLIWGISKKGKLHFSKFVPLYMYFWIMMLPFFLYGLLYSEKFVVTRIVVSLIVVYLLMKQTEWIKYTKNILLISSSISVFFTYYFYVFPSKYSIMKDFYGYFPPGTGKLETGYRAGISAHYSQNGICIAIFIIIVACILMVSGTDYSSKRKNRIYIIEIIIGSIAFLLNGKRGILVWCICAIVFAYFANSKRKISSFGRILMVAIVALVIIQVLSESIPQIEYVFTRFIAIGQDESSLERLAMWNLAIENFKRYPFFGIGFLNFRAVYSTSLFSVFGNNSSIESYRRLDAHNVYLQMLCETGIIGTVLYIIAIAIALIITYRLVRYYRYSDNSNLRFGALFSFCLQIFYILYSLSGNCLYDVTFYFYAFAIAITTSLYYRMRRDELTMRGFT